MSSFFASLFEKPEKPTLSGKFEQLILEMNVKVLTAVFQGKNRALAELAAEVNPVWREGVCQGMVLTYIRSHYCGGQAQENCRACMKGQKFMEFGLVQDSLGHQKNLIGLDHVNAVNTINKEMKDLQRMIVNDFYSPSTSSSSITQRSTSDELEARLEAKREELESTSAATIKKMADLEASYVYNSRNEDVLDMRQEVFSRVPLANIAARLESGLNEPGFYYLLIRGAGGKSHAIGFAVGGKSGVVKPRMLDPNSCELEFTDWSQMTLFLRKYFPIYNSDLGGELNGGTCTLVRYD